MRVRGQDYTYQQVADALEKANGVVIVAAGTLGCTARTIYNYAKRYATVREAMQDARQGLVGEMQGRLVKIARTENHKDEYKAILKILETYDKETDWSDKQRQEHSGSVKNIHVDLVE